MQLSQQIDEAVRAHARPATRMLFAVLSGLALVCAQAAAVAKGQKAAPKKRGPSKVERRAGGSAATARGQVPAATLLRIVRAEDERRWEASDLGALLSDASAAVRGRAALAAGRIGDEGAVVPLAALLRQDADEGVRATAAFALGETEASSGADVLLETLRLSRSPEIRARAVEALGKIAAALPEAQGERKRQLGEAILGVLAVEGRQAKPNRGVLLEGITAALRARPADAGQTVAAFLSSTDARVRADAANTLARLRAKDGVERLRSMLSTDTDAVARANAARALGAAEDAAAFDALLKQATTDMDARVRVSAVRSLALLKQPRAAEALVKRGAQLFADYKTAKVAGVAQSPAEASELLEIATALGRLLLNANQEGAVSLLRGLREAGLNAPEVETALARIAPAQYLRDKALADLVNRRGGGPEASSWQKVSAVGQGLGELAALTSALVGNSAVGMQADAQIMLRSLIDNAGTPQLAVPDLLRSLAAFKPGDLANVARAKLTARDVIVRATAADILSELPPEAETARALAQALPVALQDETNDAALSVLGALAKQRGAEADAALKTALEVTDYLVRRRAADILRERAGGGAPGAEQRRLETVATRNRQLDYERALARVSKSVRAVVSTDKGAFTIELLPEEAPLTVDNFVELARRNYYNNVAFHRVVPNFVVQGGDPRGDGNGGPGHQIRCEINTVPYERGAVGMALSGKDTGGSQWFVTHSPQPHLDGGYTVFGRVTEGLEVIDRITRGDRIRSITIVEGKRNQKPETKGRR
ncbi:MAG: peptidylprolyl isomerase [Acidobacteria bacterium]|nr:peptidylprolyl isomerase [Acidobacteriota bacterium]